MSRNRRNKPKKISALLGDDSIISPGVKNVSSRSTKGVSALWSPEIPTPGQHKKQKYSMSMIAFSPSRGASFFSSFSKNGFSKLEIVQHCGYLEKKSFYSNNILKFWKKCFFVIKDGFLIWFNSFPSGDSNFTIHPSGFLPLTGCTVSPEGKDGQGFVFQVLAPALKGKSLWLKAHTEKEANGWSEIFTQVARVPFDVIQLGKIRMDFYGDKEAKIEKSKAMTLEQARTQARLATEENDNKRELMETQMKETKRKKRLLLKQKKEAENKSLLLKKKLKQIDLKKKEMIAETKNHEKLKGNLESALESIQKLTLFVLEHNGDSELKTKILNDLGDLKKVFVES